MRRPEYLFRCASIATVSNATGQTRTVIVVKRTYRAYRNLHLPSTTGRRSGGKWGKHRKRENQRRQDGNGEHEENENAKTALWGGLGE